MSFLGNVIWFLFGGFISGLLWIIAGLLCCVTIIGIPVGLQCFKFAALSFCPFGRDIEYSSGAISLLANIIWIAICGLPMATVNAVFGVLYCITIVGIPFGLQFFKLALLALMPFGAKIRV